MTQLNIILDPAEILQFLLEDRDEVFKNILLASLNKIILEESSEQVEAAPYERSEERLDSRNRSHDRDAHVHRAAEGLLPFKPRRAFDQRIETAIRGERSFSGENSLLRLMGSVLIEMHNAMLVGKAILSQVARASLLKSDVPAKLIVIAGEQHFQVALDSTAACSRQGAG